MVDLLKYLMVKHVASFNLSCNKFLCKQGSVAIAECLRHHFTLMMQRGKKHFESYNHLVYQLDEGQP